jgi:tetratricopeptide (TPR) repeat protein
MTNLEDALIVIQDAIAAGDYLAAGKACTDVGQIFLERNLYREAAHYYQEASSQFAEAGEIEAQARSLNHLGICLVMQEDSLSALEVLNEALTLLKGAPASPLLTAIQGNIGLAYSNQNDHKNAIKSHKSVLEAAEESGDDPLRLNALINLADSNLQNKNIRSAHGFALVALDLAKALASYPGLTIIYDLLGMISSRQGNLKLAAEYHQQSFQAAQENGDLLRQGIALANKGLALEGLTDLEGALEAMNRAEELFTLLNSDYLEKTRRDLKRVRNALS